jgi:hypothetical protein
MPAWVNSMKFSSLGLLQNRLEEAVERLVDVQREMLGFQKFLKA